MIYYILDSVGVKSILDCEEADITIVILYEPWEIFFATYLSTSIVTCKFELQDLPRVILHAVTANILFANPCHLHYLQTWITNNKCIQWSLNPQLESTLVFSNQAAAPISNNFHTAGDTSYKSVLILDSNSVFLCLEYIIVIFA